MVGNILDNAAGFSATPGIDYFLRRMGLQDPAGFRLVAEMVKLEVEEKRGKLIPEGFDSF